MRMPWPRSRPAPITPSLHEFMLPQAVAPRPDDLKHVLATPAWPSPLFFAFDARRRDLFLEEDRRTARDADQHDFSGYRKKRQNHALSMLRRVRQGVVLADFEDARAPSTQQVFGRPLNVFQYNRRVGDRNAVLWRYPGCFAPGPHLGRTGGVAPVDALRFRDKRPQVFWRGSMSSCRWISPTERVSLQQEFGAEDIVRAARHYSRARAVLKSRSTPERFDFRFVDRRARWRRPGPFTESPVPKSTFLKHRYVLCPNGNDVSTALYWVIATRSLAFREECGYEVLPDHFLEPWVHYVPIAMGLGDLDEKFDWCERNPDACERMIDAANETYDRVRDPALWRLAEDTVLERLGLAP